MSEDLLSRLENSPAIRSMRIEEQVAGVLEKISWDVSHGSYYTDSIEKKIREVDVIGYQLWRKKRRDSDILLRLHLVVECKTMSGWHVVFSGKQRSGMLPRLHEFWSGKDENLERSLRKLLHEHQFSYHDIKKTFLELGRIAYPKEVMLPRSLRVEYHCREKTFTAFRETNIGGEKDLESSVLWKGVLSLKSAVNAFHDRSVGNCMSDFQFSFEYLDENERVKYFYRQYGDRARALELYYPIIVTDAILWESTGTGLKRIDAATLWMSRDSGIDDWWVEVIQKDSFEKVIHKSTKLFNGFLRGVKATRLKW